MESDYSGQNVASNFPAVLVISGFDPTGSAGILADIRVIHSEKCYPVGVITCNTVQNSKGVTAIKAVDAELVRDQLHSLTDDLNISAIKIGAIASIEIIDVISDCLMNLPGVPVVLDPVIKPTSGISFLNKEQVPYLGEKLLRHVTIATPNLDELLFLSGDAADQIDRSVKYWLESGPGHLLLTGIINEGLIIDRLYSENDDGTLEIKEITKPMHAGKNVHGTGCFLSTTLACALARGNEIFEACEYASNATGQMIANSVKFGEGSEFWINA
ncbi:MAG TPA: hydroxymethylpyrimidine/phosphomethylpyrimidine kinase [bacterium]|jgi:hydroxymethylpyrimidine/phosphomethylpyrimidine kinase